MDINEAFKKLLEDAVPVNNAGGGNIAGIGVGPEGEPGVDMKKRRKVMLLKKIIKRKASEFVNPSKTDSLKSYSD